MTKALADLLGRLEGDMLALQGMGAKMAPAAPPSNPTFEQAAPPLPQTIQAKREDYAFTKKLLEEIKGLCDSADAEIDKELKVPQQPPAEGAPAPAPSSSSGSSSKTK